MYRFLIFSLIAGVAGGIIADKKGRNSMLWAFLCFIVPALILIIVLLPARLSSGKTKQCPYCSRIVGKSETTCRHCGRELPINLVQCKSCGNFVPEKEHCMNCNKKLQK